ncbi:hypothetical protein A3A84_00260 [Candidatus Collierbacteria bacterium RIFCSPLOWO2_01_FULL_50_23]|uniref:Peptidase C39-like domain-containing protein n=1 Tax=Candidatus Collierbacteria bacterium RIFCSPHIGHO2_01_FULL_50_25 TaxID=1817722 RepID=A0A1F5EVZ9_9BACT|nr:MAG: hypothetical protein A2703_03060 [Candidatus Collierbacteria bacterium RIFCSPHIGHO2_01_FULL_50_25]OGD74534.1 MAG: hypothetical protein A3A84_00260 [Candidatus Collierbacteria bacterium RIFCSPLOWO2_01_FULL_50_23]
MVGRKKFVYQERLVKGWCGPAVLVMALRSLGFSVTQEELAKIAPYDPNWGTDHRAMLFGARHFVPGAHETFGRSLEELALIATRDAVILNFMDTELGREPLLGAGNGEDGHYILLEKLTDNGLFVVDPNPISPVDGGLRRISSEWFERHFWDIDRGWKVVERWALVIPANP